MNIKIIDEVLQENQVKKYGCDWINYCDYGQSINKYGKKYNFIVNSPEYFHTEYEAYEFFDKELYKAIREGNIHKDTKMKIYEMEGE